MTDDTTGTEDEFCSSCDVNLDLHDGPDSCAAAEKRAHDLEIAAKAERDMRREWGY